MLRLTANLFTAMLIFDIALGQIVFPEHFEIDKKKSNLAGRIPVFAPKLCNEHELLYPGDQKDDWICDCAPAAVYHPDTDRCYPVYRKGPCAEEEYLVLPDNTVVPECTGNPCKTDGFVQIRQQCLQIGSSAPCKNAQLSYVLGVDAKSLKLECIRQSLALATRIGELDDKEPIYNLQAIEPCARGTKRSIKGYCR